MVQSIKDLIGTHDVQVEKQGYIIDGEKYARVTRVLDVIAKPEFYRWFGKHGYDKCIRHRDDRASFGTRIHTEIQHFLSGESVWLDDGEMEFIMDVFYEWYETHEWEPMGLEVNLFSKNFGVAGTCDYIGLFDRDLMVLDWKTSKKVYDTYPVQVAIYMSMFEELSGLECSGAGVVCFTADGVVEKYMSRKLCLELVEVFGHMRECYRWKYKR